MSLRALDALIGGQLGIGRHDAHVVADASYCRKLVC